MQDGADGKGLRDEDEMSVSLGLCKHGAWEKCLRLLEGLGDQTWLANSPWVVSSQDDPHQTPRCCLPTRLPAVPTRANLMQAHHIMQVWTAERKNPASQDNAPTSSSLPM